MQIFPILETFKTGLDCPVLITPDEVLVGSRAKRTSNSPKNAKVTSNSSAEKHLLRVEINDFKSLSENTQKYNLRLS